MPPQTLHPYLSKLELDASDGGSRAARARGALALLVIAALLDSRVALAGDGVLAESLFREGKELMRVEDYAHACPKLSESYRQDPATGTLLALAYSQELAGQTASAWATYNDVVVRARQEGQSDREQAARSKAKALEPKLSKLVVEVPAELADLDAFAVKRDGVPLPTAAWGSPFPVDPGQHTLEATATGRRPWRESVSIGPQGDLKTVRVPLLESDPSASTETPAKPRAVPDGGAGPAKPAEPVASSGPWRTVGIAVGAGGLVALGVGAGFALRARGLDADSKRNGHCTAATGCDATGHELNQSALAAGRAATVLVVAGGALVAAGVTLYLVGGSHDEGSATLACSPLVASNGGGVLLHGGF